MRILCLDYGEKRIGVAVSDPLGASAQPIGVIGQDLTELEKIIKKYDGVSEIVVGLPKTLRGEIGPQAKKTLEFVSLLKEKFSIPVITWDERLSTASASRSLQEVGINTKKQRGMIDKVAAAIILQSYLDSKKHE